MECEHRSFNPTSLPKELHVRDKFFFPEQQGRDFFWNGEHGPYFALF
jgi:hypothetical protein